MKDLGPRDRTIPCPSCAAKLHLHIEQGQLLNVSLETEALPVPASVQSPASFRLLFGVLGTLVAAVLIYFAMSNNSAPVLSESDSPDGVTEKNELVEDSPDASGEGSPAPDEDVPPVEGELSIAQRLKVIHGLVQEYRQQNGVYPNGKMLEVDGEPARFSWVAEVMRTAERDGSLMAQRRAWDDPVNDAFVRRRLEQFQNPEINQLAGDDRYPTTHFAGVTGVGVESEKLPLRHPRAGIFSPYRETTIADVLDGTANTMMLVGVQADYGSWARPGPATLRGFTAEPYINGPDGMGTGQPDSMQVLMADGSVRTLSQKTSPIIVRRMAAMADGLTLSLEMEGDPLTMKSEVAVAQGPVEKKDPEADLPIEPMLAEDPPPFDIEESLSQKIRSYRLEQPKPLRVILSELQEISGVPMDLSALDEATMDRESTLVAEETTLKGLFEELASSQGLEIELKPFAIVVRGKGDSPEE
ncbi:hypothetical protein [Thalassoglobus polymorphus]|uniref:Uncharacterized protein n=1 Tax=Thalassoglobus polymorphus TaxID=2527994 RepID=A0A517QSL1_9PLAN|nr:hypothetical protein [Thalassoglobus polymorphus]QDT34614.1 hypothetical protein Mal48_38770 [Thalassoglobus polymorphus]